MRPFVIVTALSAVAFGLIQPSVAARSAHVLVAGLSMVALIAWIQPSLTDWQITRAKPFVREEPEIVRAIAPTTIVEIADDVTGPDRYLSPRVRSRLALVARGRAADMDAATAVDFDRRLSPQLAAIVREDDTAGRIAARHLVDLLDEVENL